MEWQESLNRDLTYKERLLIADWPEEEIKDWDEQRCEEEYDAAMSTINPLNF